MSGGNSQGGRHANIPIFVPHAGCPQRCSFCNQKTVSGAESGPDPARAAEICRAGFRGLSSRFEGAEIAFFGGSFTAIPRGEMLALLDAVQPFRREPGFRGIRISTRPDAITMEILGILKNSGVRAIELGAQSLYNTVLEANGRGHTAEQVEAAAGLIRREGFELGLQMMTGLYGSTPEMDWGTGERVADLAPDTVRIYPTVVLPGTRLARLMEAGEYRPPALSETVDLCARLLELFEGRGIRVIRLGLHATEALTREALGGGVHPALGELCRSRLMLWRFQRELEARPGLEPLEILVPPRALSQAAGQKKCNLLALRERWPGMVIRPDPALSEGFQIRYKGMKDDKEEVLYATSGH